MTKRFANFRAFYPFYLSEHQNRLCRRFHFIGSWLVILTLAAALIFSQWRLLWLAPLFGYGFAWAGHGFFEKNRPATFSYPLYSLIGDWVMFKDILMGKLQI